MLHCIRTLESSALLLTQHFSKTFASLVGFLSGGWELSWEGGGTNREAWAGEGTVKVYRNSARSEAEKSTTNGGFRDQA